MTEEKMGMKKLNLFKKTNEVTFRKALRVLQIII